MGEDDEKEVDKKGTIDMGPKSWASTSSGNEDNSCWIGCPRLWQITMIC